MVIVGGLPPGGYGAETEAQPWSEIAYVSRTTPDPALAVTVTDGACPVNPTLVGRYTYGAGTTEPPFGNSLQAPFSAQIKPPASWTYLYMAWYFKFSSNWFFPAHEIKQCNIWVTSDGSAIIPEIRGTTQLPEHDSWPTTGDPPYFAAVRIAQSATAQGGLIDTQIDQTGVSGTHPGTAFVTSTPALVNGVWYFIEYLFDYPGKRVKIWVDNVLKADATHTKWQDGIVAGLGWEGTLGGQCGGCPELPADMYYYQGGSCYMSYKV